MAEAKVQQTLFKPDPDAIVDIPVEQLILDAENARLAYRLDGDSREDLVRILWTEMAVDEVALSIAANGFFRSEPLFVIIENPQEKDRKKQRFTVVEGNRRLAAVLLLRSEPLRKKMRATNLPEINAERHAGLDTIPAIIYPSRESLWTSVGFRHISGIKTWGSFSKAKYVADVHESYGIPLPEIASRIGDRHSTVRRLYRGYKILQQAESQAGFDRKDIARNRLFFSHLYTAVDQKAFQHFLSIDPEGSLKPNPVPESKLTELAELMTWLYGKKSRGIEPVVRRQNPDLNTLREVVSKQDSLSALRSGYSLERSHAIAIGEKRRFRDALISAKVELQNAMAAITTGYAGEDDLYDVFRDIVKISDSIRREMETKREHLHITRTKQPGHQSGPRRR